MSFAHPHFLWLLLVIPPALMVFFWWSARTRQRLMTQFIQVRLLPGLVVGVSPMREKTRAAALILAAVFLITALARPQWGYDLQEVKQRGLDIVVAIDTSKSMLAEDIAPNRLARAKYAALDLMQQAKSDRLGLIAFAGTAFLQCPLTIDDSAFRQIVESLNVNTLPQGGTALAEAIETAAKAFKEGDSYKVLVLFSDGEDQDSGALEAANKAAEEGLRIFTIGIGSAEGELLRIKAANGQSDYVRDENGNVVKSHLNESLLQEIAGAAQGFYLPMRGANTIDTLYQKGLAPLPKSESQEKWVRRAIDRYHWPLALAILLLLAEIFFPERKQEKRRAIVSSPSKSLTAKTALLVLILMPIAGFGSPSSALKEYKSGKYDQALKEYEQSLQKQTDDPRLHFNAGAAAYRNQQFDQAAKHFNQALSSPDLNLQQQSYYNLGNTLFHEGEQNPDPSKKTETWEASLKKYESSLKLNPQDPDARFNLEFVKKKLEELKQQQQQQKQDSKDSKEDQDQQKQDQSKQNQQQDQSKQQQEKSDQQKQSEQNQKPDSQLPSEKDKDQKQEQQAKQSPDKKDQNQDQKQQPGKPEPEKKDQASGEESEANTPYAPGQMTPQQARQLLDAQKGDEMVLPVKPEQKASGASKPIKDW
jgi:Ca-activated chloride channel homolog